MTNPSALADVEANRQYKTLIDRWMLAPITSTEDYNESLKLASELVQKGDDILPGEVVYFRVLSMLIQDYENKRPYLADAVTGPQVLAYLLRENSISQSEIAFLTGTAKQTINDYLKSRRPLPREVRQSLMKRFRLTKDLFDYPPTPGKFVKASVKMKAKEKGVSPRKKKTKAG